MIKFEDACQRVGYDRSAERPQTIYKYYAYIDGKVYEFFKEKNLNQRLIVRQDQVSIEEDNIPSI